MGTRDALLRISYNYSWFSLGASTAKGILCSWISHVSVSRSCRFLVHPAETLSGVMWNAYSDDLQLGCKWQIGFMRGLVKSRGVWCGSVRESRGSEGKNRQMWGSLDKIHLCVDAKRPFKSSITRSHDALEILSARSCLPQQLRGKVGGGATPSTQADLCFTLPPPQSACHSHKHTAEREW